MKGALLVCDHIRKELLSIDGEYPDMFAKLLPELDLTPYWVCDGEFPATPDSHDFYICSGSRFSVYDDIPWIHQLKHFFRQVSLTNRKLIGSCFGHQMIAQSLGGSVEKAEVGWSVGVGQFDVVHSPNWMQPMVNQFQLLLMCQDQVAVLPKGSKVHAASDKCPIGVFTVNDQFLGVQPHPEFSKAYHEALFSGRSEQIGDSIIEEAISTMNRELHTKEVVQWMTNFLRS